MTEMFVYRLYNKRTNKFCEESKRRSIWFNKIGPGQLLSLYRRDNKFQKEWAKNTGQKPYLIDLDDYVVLKYKLIQVEE